MLGVLGTVLPRMDIALRAMLQHPLIYCRLAIFGLQLNRTYRPSGDAGLTCPRASACAP